MRIVIAAGLAAAGRRVMLDRHARYMPVMNQNILMGVISFYDVAKAYIRDWPVKEDGEDG